MSATNDLTIVYYTANHAPETFTQKTREQLVKATNGVSIISVSQKPINLGENICVGDIGRTHLNIYRQALIGAKAAKTKYIAMAEDDVLYSPDHFKYRPTSGKFGYNKSLWCIYTWKPNLFSYKDRINLYSLICERDLFIEAMEERFAKYPDDTKIDLSIFAEPSKYEGHLGVTKREAEIFYSDIPNIAFSHETALSFSNLGKRKKLGILKAIEIPYWGKAKELCTIYPF